MELRWAARGAARASSIRFARDCYWFFGSSAGPRTRTAATRRPKIPLPAAEVVRAAQLRNEGGGEMKAATSPGETEEATWEKQGGEAGGLADAQAGEIEAAGPHSRFAAGWFAAGQMVEARGVGQLCDQGAPVAASPRFAPAHRVVAAEGRSWPRGQWQRRADQYSAAVCQRTQSRMRAHFVRCP